jgi:chemotaxis protein MotB
LLFESGSTVVDPKGVDALKKLAKVLEREADVTVLIEGHTDNVPIKSATIKDNWDLSVLRATSIVRILTSSSKIDPQRLTAAGRGEFFPIDKANTPEARKKNRRTEIILTPNLDKLFELINSGESR